MVQKISVMVQNSAKIQYFVHIIGKLNLLPEDDGATELEVVELDELFAHSTVSYDRNVDCV